MSLVQPAGSPNGRRVGLNPQRQWPMYMACGALVDSDFAERDCGVQGNVLGYPDSGVLHLHISGLEKSDRDPSPVPDARGAVQSVDRRRLGLGASAPAFLLAGEPNDGVSGVRVRARLLIGVRGAALVADEKEYATSSGGWVAIPFRTGAHPEEVTRSCGGRDNHAWPILRYRNELSSH